MQMACAVAIRRMYAVVCVRFGCSACVVGPRYVAIHVSRSCDMHAPVLLLPERHLYLFGLLLYMLCDVLACNACCCFAREMSHTGLRCLQEKIGFPQCLVR